MGRKITPLEAAEDAFALLDQAILILDDSNIDIPAAHADLARHSLGNWLSNARGPSEIVVKSKMSRLRSNEAAKYDQ